MEIVFVRPHRLLGRLELAACYSEGIALILSAGDKTVYNGDDDLHAFPRCQRGKPNLHLATLPSEHFVRHSDV